MLVGLVIDRASGRCVSIESRVLLSVLMSMPRQSARVVAAR